MFRQIALMAVSLTLLTPAQGNAEGSVAQTAATVRLVDNISVEAPNIRLRDIATVQTDSEELRQALLNLKVSEAPSLSTSRMVSAYKIKGIIEDAGYRDITVRGQSTQVNTAFQVIKSEELKARIEDWILANESSDEELEVTFSNLPKAWKVPKGEEVEIQISTARAALEGNVGVSLKAVAGTRVYAHTRARVNVRKFKNALVLIRPIRKGGKNFP